MNPIFQKMLSFFISVILPIMLGYAIKKIFRLSKDKFDILLQISILFVLPISMVLLFWAMNPDKNMLLLPIIGLLTPLMYLGFGYLFSRKKYTDPKQKGSYIIASMLSNRGTIGGLVAYILFGEIGYIYVYMVNLFAPVNNFVIAFPLANYFSSESSAKPTLKSIFFRKTNLPVIGIIAGVLLHIFAGDRPEFITPLVDPLIKGAAWFTLIPVGASIELHSIKKHLRKVLDIGIIKFIIMPVFGAVIALLFIPDRLMAIAFVLVHTMPVAIDSVVVSRISKLDENVAVSAFLYTTIVYLFIVFPMTSIILS
ncbi:MAG: hypothetical protein JXN65_11115 [Clostridia bacterium]|nr:hypothetical protein [Clostridia bacterium]